MSAVSRSVRVSWGAAIALAGFACSDKAPPVGPEDGGTSAGAMLQARRSTTGSDAAGYIVVLKQGARAELSTAVGRLGGKVKRSFPEVGLLSATGLDAAAAAALARNPAVEAVVPNLRLQLVKPPTLRVAHGLAPRSRFPSSTDQSGALAFALQWNLHVIQADDAWLTTPQGAGARVAVLDTGIDHTHIELAGTVDESCSESFVEGESPLTDFVFHGTLVAAVIKSNGIVAASVAPDATLCSLKVGNAAGASTDAIAAALIFSAQNRLDVANISFGALVSTNDPDIKAFLRAFQRIVDFAARNGVLLVAAAGNDGVNTNTDARTQVDFPADLNHVISVGATAPVGQQNFDQIASYSNYGREGVDVFAPGGDFVEGSVEDDLILGPCSPSSQFFDCSDRQSYLIASGTSFAAPHVVGEAAVIESEFPGDQNDEYLAQCILKSADLVTDRRIDPLYHWGRINVLRGAECAPATASRTTAHPDNGS
jgi:subtilisin family serine protease